MTIQKNVFLALLGGTISINAIMNACGYSEWQVRHAINRLRLAGAKITKHGNCVFTMTQRPPNRYRERQIFRSEQRLAA